MKTVTYSRTQEFEKQIARPAMEREELEKIVKIIFDEVKRKGDDAVRKYTYHYDGVKLEDIAVSEAEIEASEAKVSKELKEAIQQAKNNIEKFHSSQFCESKKVTTMQGVTCWERAIGIEKVGLYVPGGSAPLFSSVLMLAIPAKIAGCREIVLCTPPGKDGSINSAILYAAKISGVTRIFKAGGIQAVAGMTYGTQSMPKVYKIFGPGNQYVTAAKMQAFSEGIAIDMPAGPSEVMVITDKTSIPCFVASDLLSQAEHGEDSQVVLVAVDGTNVDEISSEVERQLAALPRKSIAEKALAKSVIVKVKSYEEALEVANIYAPEHLIISLSDSSYFAQNVVNAGSVFLGMFTPESAGDYASGTNHTLPTNGFAKAYSGISLDSFVKKVFFQEITEEGIRNIGSTVEVMAENEMLMAHKQAVSIRLNYLKK